MQLLVQKIEFSAAYCLRDDGKYFILDISALPPKTKAGDLIKIENNKIIIIKNEHS